MPNLEPVDAGPTIRRLEQLGALGVTGRELAAAVGRPLEVIDVLYFLHWISPATAAAVERAGEMLRAAR